MKINPSSPLSQLSDDEQLTLISWLEKKPVKDVLDMVALPKPQGFGIKTHRNTLRRFYARYEHQQRREDYDLAKELVQTPPSDSADLRKATLLKLQKMAFDLATAPAGKLSQFKALARWCLKLSDQEQRLEMINITREKLALDRKKFEFNAARAALLHLHHLRQIATDDTIDDEDKIRAARKRMFGDSVPD